FFFSSRRRHTRFSRDWSSDVCSSDLRDPGGHEASRRSRAEPWRSGPLAKPTRPVCVPVWAATRNEGRRGGPRRRATWTSPRAGAAVRAARTARRGAETEPKRRRRATGGRAASASVHGASGHRAARRTPVHRLPPRRVSSALPCTIGTVVPAPMSTTAGWVNRLPWISATLFGIGTFTVAVPEELVANASDTSTLTHNRQLAPIPRKPRFSGSGIPLKNVRDAPR